MSINKNKRRIISALGYAALLPLLPRTAMASPPVLTGETMGTRYRLQLTKMPDAISLRALRSGVIEILQTTEQSMSLYRSDSEISRFNQLPVDAAFSASPALLKVVSAAMTVKSESGNAYDPCVEALVRKWGFGPRAQRSATSHTIATAASRSKSGAIIIDKSRLVKRHSALSIDLNGIAKGYAMDIVASLLKQHEINHFLLEIGGEVVTAGVAPGDQPWRIGIAHPEGGIDEMIAVSDKAVATSGDYLDFYMAGKKRISHLIDPRSGIPINHSLATVSVIADNAMHADAWATALMVLGPEHGVSTAIMAGLPARFLLRHEDGYRQILTPGFAQHLT